MRAGTQISILIGALGLLLSGVGLYFTVASNTELAQVRTEVKLLREEVILLTVDSTPTPVAKPTAMPTPTVTPTSIPPANPGEASLKQWIRAQDRYTSTQVFASVGDHVWAAFRVEELMPILVITHSSDAGNPEAWGIQHLDRGWLGHKVPKAFSIQFLSGDEGWVAADLAIYHTKDGGKKWNKVWECQLGSFDKLVGFQAADSLHLTGEFNRGGTLITSDGGQNWELSGATNC